jgi:predicted ATP-dependent endonuclease of OLD family
MKIIEKIEIKSFRSFCNRKGDKSEIDKILDLNIFSGANDSGKSNILRALNLFFNKRTSLGQFFSFEQDYFRKDIKGDNKDIKEELVTIRITFRNTKNKDKNASQKDKLFLPENFWVSRKFTKNSEHSTYSQSSGVETSFKKEKGESHNTFLDKEGKLKSNFSASLQKQLTDFLDSIQYHYIPAIKDKNYFSHLYGELRQTLLKAKESNVDNKKGDFEKAIQDDTKSLMSEFEIMLGDTNVNIAPVFELPDLVNLFQSLNVQTGGIPLRLRGDGIQAKLIPEILDFISIKEQALTSKKIKLGQKAKKYFIWGFEEPENSYEYKNAQLLANKFQKIFIKDAQIFITTHSFNFLSLEGENIATYRVWRDEKIRGSRVTKIKKDANGKFQFEGDDSKTDSEKLHEELGVFQLNKDLDNLFIETEKTKKEFFEEKKKIKALILKRKKVLFTEGPTDKIILEQAWKKLFPEKEKDFVIIAMGGATHLQNYIQHDFPQQNEDRIGVALFDFDQEGYSQWNGINTKKGFNDVKIHNTLGEEKFKKHNNKNIFATFLNVPKHLENYVFERKRLLSVSNLKLQIEHLFILKNSDVAFLKLFKNCKKERGIFEIPKSKPQQKDYEDFVGSLKKNDFQNFVPLFEKLNKFFEEKNDWLNKK